MKSHAMIRFSSSPITLSVFLAAVILIAAVRESGSNEDQVRIDYQMAEKSIGWLEYLKQGASDKEIEDYFKKHVTPTDGCKSIIQHWERFMEWDNDTFLKFILEGLDRIATDRPLENEDGSLTALGRRRMFWLSAVDRPQQLRDDLIKMKQANLAHSAAALARQYLPKTARIKADFYVVLFGGSNAFSVGEVNGFDLLQMPRNADGSLDLDDALKTFAHEMHHTGYAECNKSKGGEHTQLVAILAAEGMPTYFIDRLPDWIGQYEKSHDRIRRDLAAVWQEHTARLPELYAEAEADIRLSLEKGAGPDDMFERWMGGLKGAAYVLGADMFSVIDTYLGPDSAVVVAGDHRRFLKMYDKAAHLANAKGEQRYIFNKELADRIADY